MDPALQARGARSAPPKRRARRTHDGAGAVFVEEDLEQRTCIFYRLQREEPWLGECSGMSLD